MAAICGRTINMDIKEKLIINLENLASVMAYKNKQVAIKDIESFPKPALQKLIDGVKRTNNHKLLIFTKNFFSDKYKKISPKVPNKLLTNVVFK